MNQEIKSPESIISENRTEPTESLFPAKSAIPNHIFSDDFNLCIILQAPARYVRDHFGREKLEEICTWAGLESRDLEGKTKWGSIEQVEIFFKNIRELLRDENEFKEACCYRLSESLGPMRFLLRAFSPASVFERMVKTFPLVTRVGRAEVTEYGRNSICIRYKSTKSESRLICLSRQAQAEMIPTLWGLPKALYSETKCIANGDDACEFKLTWYESRRWMPMIIGGLAGGICAYAMYLLYDSYTIPSWVTFPLLGAALGHILEMHRTHKANIEIGEQINNAMRQIADEDTEAQREILALNKRQHEWSRMMEEQVAERTAMLNQVIERIKEMQVERVSNLRGFTHDLRNPLGVMKGGASYLKYQKERSDSEVDLLNGIENAASTVSDMLEDLLVATESETGFVKITPQNVETESLAEQLRRRVRALAHGREIRVSVFSTRETPEIIETDIQVLNRVIDNLLTNAVKYTERGSIVVELDGLPGFLTIKVSDTGRGIEEGKIKQIFRPHGSDEYQRAPGSWGLGLSVVVQLLDQIGGKLEVMSKLNTGTTFWAHFPVEISTDGKMKEKEEKTDAFARVVKIRPVSQS